LTVHREEHVLVARGRGLHSIDEDVAAVVARSGVKEGLCSIFVLHTSASLVIQENADPSVRRDLERALARLAPEGADYEHDAEGADDMPAHIRTALTHTSETIPVVGGRLRLGTWQAIYLWEHRSARHARTIVVTVLGE
jgi:secondary thiamine-phosphate synthase enzyme